jgi:hypothetical protein
MYEDRFPRIRHNSFRTFRQSVASFRSFRQSVGKIPQATPARFPVISNPSTIRTLIQIKSFAISLVTRTGGIQSR